VEESGGGFIMSAILGTGGLLKRLREHPYIGKDFLKMESVERRILSEVNEGRNYRGEAVEATYYITAYSGKGEFEGIKNAIKDILNHGTTENWTGPEKEPEEYQQHMSWLKEVKLLGFNSEENLEAAIATICIPLEFFDKECDGPSLTQLRMATSSEPFNALVNFTARLIDYRFPAKYKSKFLGQIWYHKRIREYLGLDEDEPIIGVIVKPKWLPKDLFAQHVVEAAKAGALFIKSDENLHLSIKELADYVSLTVRLLEKNGFDLSLSTEPKLNKKRIIFAPHITVRSFSILEYARIAVDCGANALCFSPHLAGDFEVIKEIYKMGEKYCVPIYAHTAGMNRYTGDPMFTFGEDPKTAYLLAGLSGAAFMQLPALGGYIRPMDVEKFSIIERLKEEGLVGNKGMTLVIAGGLGAHNIGYNIRAFGPEGKMFLAGTAVYHHPDGIKSGILALKLAVEAAYEGIINAEDLRRYARSLGERGYPLMRALK
jgi:ribulose 1,5-bisphosphate carboxylase large subunit-like protein